MLPSRRNIYLLTIVLILSVGCSVKKLTPTQQMAWGASVYNDQYRSYLLTVLKDDVTEEQLQIYWSNPELITADMIDPTLSIEQKKILRVKKDILKELKKLIIIANQFNETGSLPPDDVQNKLTELINRLLTEIGD